MEFPLFALKTGDTKPLHLEFDNKIIDIRGSQDLGRASIFDKDVWIYCISKMMQAKYEQKDISRTVQFTTYNYLVTTNRGTSGREYINFKNSLNRLAGTRIYTNIKTGNKEQERNWGLIDNWEIIREGDSGKLLHIEVTLPDWLYRSIYYSEILKISPDYFRLRKPIDRRIYEIARKHCGNNKSWRISLDKLKQKAGSSREIRKFRDNIKSLAKTNELPDYLIEYEKENDIIIFVNRNQNEQEEVKEIQQNIQAYENKLAVKKQAKISVELKKKINEITKYYPDIQNSGILAEENLIDFIKNFGEKRFLTNLKKLKKINLSTINNPRQYFFKMMLNEYDATDIPSVIKDGDF